MARWGVMILHQNSFVSSEFRICRPVIFLSAIRFRVVFVFLLRNSHHLQWGGIPPPDRTGDGLGFVRFCSWDVFEGGPALGSGGLGGGLEASS